MSTEMELLELLSVYTLRNSRVLITGGAGFVGSFIADHLIAEGVKEIILLDNFVRGSKNNIEKALSSGIVTLVDGDIRDIELLYVLLENVDYCFHMAALRITRCSENPREALEVMFSGTFNVIEACIRHQVRKIVVASSASIYGQAEMFPTHENHHPYNNRTLYGAAKTANELMLRAFHDMNKLDYVAMRYFNIFGPRMDTEGKYTEVLIRWYYLIKQGKPPLIFGDGRQSMDFVFVEDVARANILGLKSEVTNEVFNVGNQVETSLEELCYALLKAMKSDLKPKYLPLPPERKSVEVRRRLADMSKAKEMIGFEAKVSLDDGLTRLVNWLDGLEVDLH